MSLELYLAYCAACVVLVIVPGPTVTLIVANSLTHGTRAGLINVAGTQLALAVMIGVVAVGLGAMVATMGWWFNWLKLAGAAYLVWIGIKMLRSTGQIGLPGATSRPKSFFWQGFFVLLANPKVLLLFGAFIPQFVDVSQPYFMQVVFLGLTFMAIATVFDTAYAFLAGGAGKMLSAQRVRLISRLSGLSLIGGGVWLALIRTR
ncbi:homoserine/homoserine lactone efflux protein [Variibacter gotjawalensis]|uniref:Homoserine/homoserine lactone efflux protein n=1 Tax=Variibacter gotjawalensis TaxID=1333996 RepID=A0A0S3PRB3_9BRAD|nr:LysE family translocator [Variibacter gotjawalensis]NIK48803.1 threonine/homoserine/homoserine lactone efflux protein [Variibacter gotjawalensis]RZS50664.1 threonine/homoserine/homoserine lactone efflux protein [Variibacter gotjawalensis]BAT58497.1 homoserine/homoserine lactone efflux protein [Variibacter gotjawalensis]